MEYNWAPAGSWARADLADRFLPDGLANASAVIPGAEAKPVSTAGDKHQWETRILRFAAQQVPRSRGLNEESPCHQSGQVRHVQARIPYPRNASGGSRWRIQVEVALCRRSRPQL